MRENRIKLGQPPTGSAPLTSPYRQEPFTPSLPRLARVREGALALVLVARTVWADAALRRFYLRVAIAQSALTLFLGFFAIQSIFDDDGDDDQGGRHRRRRREAKGVVVSEVPGDQGIVIKGDKSTIVINPRGFDIRSNDEDSTPPGAESAESAEADDAPAPPGSEGAAAPASPSAPNRAKAPQPRFRVGPFRQGQGPRVSIHHTSDDDDDDSDEGASAAGDESDDDHESKGEVTTSSWGVQTRLAAFWRKLVTCYGALVAIGWVIVALSRDYHDAIAREASLRLNLPPEDPPLVPRVRLNLPWLKAKLKRRFRGFILFTLGVPPLWALSFFVVLPLMGINHLWSVFDTGPVISRLYGLLAALWGAYWLIVFTGAKTALAWAHERTATEPWYLRVWGSLTQRLPETFAWLPRGYGRAWWNMSQRVFSPTRCFEQAPYEFTGLAALRLLGSVPGLYPFVRPLVPVAAALLVTRHVPPPEPARPNTVPPAPGGGTPASWASWRPQPSSATRPEI